MTPEPPPEQPDETPHVAMRHYVVCYDTADYPGVYAVRKHLVFAGRSRPAELLGVVADLAAARAAARRIFREWNEWLGRELFFL